MNLLFSNYAILSIIIVWSIVWKGIALWHSARNKQLAWFVVILIVNTIGILEIVYLVFCRKEQTNNL